MIVSWSAPKYDILSKMISWSIVGVECLFKVNENDAIQEAMVDVGRPAIVASSKAVMVLCKERNPDWQPDSSLLSFG